MKTIRHGHSKFTLHPSQSCYIWEADLNGQGDSFQVSERFQPMRNLRLWQERSEITFTSVASLWAGYVLTSKTLAFAWLPSLWHLVTTLCPYGFRLGEGDWQPHCYWPPSATLSLWFLYILPTPLQMVFILNSQNSQFEHELCFCWPWLTSIQGKTINIARHTPSTPCALLL